MTHLSADELLILLQIVTLNPSVITIVSSFLYHFQSCQGQNCSPEVNEKKDAIHLYCFHNYSV